MLPADSPFVPLPAPGPHPATAALRAYAAGTLGPAEAHRIEAHALDCERCAELLDGFSMSDAATTDRAVAELRTRLQARVGVPHAAPAPPRTWPRLAAAAALVGAVAAGLWGLEQRAADAPPATVARQETSPLAPAEPASPAATTTAPRLEAVTVAPTAAAAETQSAPATEAATGAAAKTAAYAAVTTAPARPRPAPVRAVRRPPRPAAPAAAATPAAATADLVATAGTDQVDKAMEMPETKQMAAAPQASAPANADEVQGSPVASDAKKMLKQQVAVADSDTVRTSASPRVASKATGRLVQAAAPALSRGAAGRGPATPMPVPAAINPAPVGGTSALREYLRKTAVEFEPEARTLRLTGSVHVRFTVGADGKLTDFNVTRGLRDDYDAEAIRIIREGPAWQPGVAGGRRAPLPMEVTVPF